MKQLVSLFLFQYTALFSIINPIGCAIIIFAITRTLAEPERVHLVKRIATFSWVMLLVSYLIGIYVLNFFGVSLPILRVAGGLIVTLAAWSMLTTSEDPTHSASPQVKGNQNISDSAFFPFTLPLTIGPGTISTAITLAADAPNHTQRPIGSFVVAFVVITLIAYTIYVCYRYAGKLTKLLGKNGTDIIARLSGFLLFCIGIQIIWLGVRELLLSILQT
jgi:multiple antibiotic resistance protein